MSTRSHIGIRNEDGSLDVIYCHWDGYPSYNGAVLFHHCQEPEKIRELIALGDISSLAASVKPAEGEHTFDSPQDGVTVAYGRDRGEDGTEPLQYGSVDEYTRDLKLPRNYLRVEYAYLYREAEAAWYWVPVQENGHLPEFQPLTNRDALIA